MWLAAIDEQLTMCMDELRVLRSVAGGNAVDRPVFRLSEWNRPGSNIGWTSRVNRMESNRTYLLKYYNRQRSGVGVFEPSDIQALQVVGKSLDGIIAFLSTDNSGSLQSKVLLCVAENDRRIVNGLIELNGVHDSSVTLTDAQNNMLELSVGMCVHPDEYVRIKPDTWIGVSGSKPWSQIVAEWRQCRVGVVQCYTRKYGGARITSSEYESMEKAYGNIFDLCDRLLAIKFPNAAELNEAKLFLSLIENDGRIANGLGFLYKVEQDLAAMAETVKTISDSRRSVSAAEKESLLHTMDTLLTTMQSPTIGMCISPLAYEDLLIEYFRIIRAIRLLGQPL